MSNTVEPVWAWLQGGQLKTAGGNTLDWFPQTVPKAFSGEPGEPGNHSARFRIPRGGLFLKINSRLYNGGTKIQRQGFLNLAALGNLSPGF